MSIDSIDDNGRRDFVRNGTIEITFPPSNNIQEKEVLISLVDDQINEAEEGFLVLVDADNIFIPEEVVDLIRDGVTVVKIVDNDRKQFHVVNNFNITTIIQLMRLRYMEEN